MTHLDKLILFKDISRCYRYKTLMKYVDSPIIFPFYHTVSDIKLPHITHLYQTKDTFRFEQDLEHLLKIFIPISIEDVKNKNFEKGKYYMHLSFDDGLIENHSIVAPILKSKGIPASFFINPTFVNNDDWMYRYEASLMIDLIKNKAIDGKKKLIAELKSINNARTMALKWNELGLNRKIEMRNKRIYMNEDEISDLYNQGFHIGAHSMTHPLMTTIDEEKQRQEIIDSMEWVSQRYPSDIKSFAFPFSDDGISKSLIKELIDNNDIDMGFGTSGVGSMDTMDYYQRMPMEHEFHFKAEEIVKSELFVNLLKKKYRKKK